MNLQQLITFSTVVSEGSMTAAAEKLYLTQPAVSQQIKNLEDELGVGLLDRGSRQAKLTPQGQLLYEYAKRILSLTQQAQAAIQTMGSGVSGRLKVGTVNSIGLQFVSPVIGNFLKHNSRVSLSLKYHDSEQIWSELLKGELDVAILPETEVAEHPAQIEPRVLMKDEIWLVTSGKEPGVPDVVGMEEMRGKPFVGLTERYKHFDDELDRILKATGLSLNYVFESNNVGTLKRVIESGLGWGFLPAHAIRKQIRMGRLVRIDTTGPVQELSQPFNIMFFWRPQSELSAAADLLYRTLKQQGQQGSSN